MSIYVNVHDCTTRNGFKKDEKEKERRVLNAV